MQIRQLTDQEFDERVELSMYAFQYELAAEEMTEVRSRFKPEETWGVFIQNRLAAQLTLIPLQIYLHGKTFSMGGIASVSTWPEFRRQGLVAHLLTHAMELMKENGQTISFLTPFAFDFYRKYGWETYIDYKRYEIETALLPKRKETGGHVEQRTGNIELLSGIYEEYASRYNGTLRRTKEWWETLVLRRKKRTCSCLFSRKWSS
ncbi:GNAT family N-acetyltransferase [Ectobacillus funiculus]|uniref:Enhanced intracellular survival protein Eis n=1 Tax=Ectobacillus funiculus TaxID=137993 RepID=A0ABV5WB63_9BACI